MIMKSSQELQSKVGTATSRASNRGTLRKRSKLERDQARVRLREESPVAHVNNRTETLPRSTLARWAMMAITRSRGFSRNSEYCIGRPGTELVRKCLARAEGRREKLV